MLHKCFAVIVILKCCESVPKPESENHIVELYRLLQKTVNDTHNDTKTHSLRRVFVDKSEYQIHINKLKDVNGFKMHNIIIELPKTNSFIYITNPLESKLPHPFMTLEEFKNTLIEQQLKNREAFEKSKLKDENILRSEKSKTTVKFNLTRPHNFSKTVRNVTIPKKITIKAAITRKKTIKEITKKNKVQNGSKTVTTQVLSQTTKTKQSTSKSTKPIEKIAKVKNVSSSLVDVKEKNTTKPYFRVKLVGSDQTAPTKHKTYIHKTEGNNKTLNNETLYLEKQSVKKNSVASETLETRVNVNMKDTNNNTLTNNSTNIGVPEQENNTVYFEKSENMTDAVSTISVQEESDERMSTTHSEEVISTIDKKESIHILGRLSKIEEESDSFEAFAVLNGEKLSNMDDEERTTVFEETITEPTTTTSTTTVPTTTAVKVKWSRPRVFMEPPDTGSTPET